MLLSSFIHCNIYPFSTRSLQLIVFRLCCVTFQIFKVLLMSCMLTYVK
jgi:hypothetical protein